VQTGIGATLREARNRRGIDLAEVEAAIKIRARYLRAMENEEWGALPGGAYSRGFIRTYAGYLGLDGERLAEDYRHESEPATRLEAPAEPAGGPRRPRSSFSVPWPSDPLKAVLVSLGLLALLVVIVLLSQGGGSDQGSTQAGSSRGEERASHSPVKAQVAPGVSLQLATTGEIWICLLDAKGQPLVDGEVLEAGAREGPFHSDSFTVSFGNGEIEMRIDGKEAEIPPSASPVGYEVGSDGKLRSLGETERPTCV
jgi:transcriptional regulator with XRE-family HTH domain